MLINLSNHPSSRWDTPQIQAAVQFGEITDMPFPEIEPEWDSKQVEQLAEVYFNKITTIAREKDAVPVVHVMGEYSFCFKLVVLLKKAGIKAVVSTSKRHSVKNPDGTKTIQFNFVQFRPYY